MKIIIHSVSDFSGNPGIFNLNLKLNTRLIVNYFEFIIFEISSGDFSAKLCETSKSPVACSLESFEGLGGDLSINNCVSSAETSITCFCSSTLGDGNRDSRILNSLSLPIDVSTIARSAHKFPLKKLLINVISEQLPNLPANLSIVATRGVTII